LIGSIRRECLDHVIVWNARRPAARLERLLEYYQRSRTHLSLDNDAPIPRPIMAHGDGPVVVIPQVGGLHHLYERRAG
jgi:putative transposase